MKNTILILIIFVVGAAVSSCNNNHTEINKELSAILVKDQAFTERELRIPLDTVMNYEQVIDSYRTATSQREELIASLSTIYPDVKSDARDSIKEFLLAENGFIKNRLQIISDRMKCDDIKVQLHLHQDTSDTISIDNLKAQLQQATNAYHASVLTCRVTYNELCDREVRLQQQGIVLTPLYARYRDVNRIN